MTDHEADVLAAIYRLGDLIRAHDWPQALACWEWVLTAYAPMQELQPHVKTMLEQEVAMVRIAERQSSKIH